MAGITTTTQTVLDGNRRTVIRITGLATDTTQESGVVKVDPTLLSPAAIAGASLKIAGMKYDIVSGLVILQWDANTPLTFMILGGAADHVDFMKYGGIPNNAGAGVNGKIKLTTQGFGVGSSYDITIELIKTTLS